jgi:riboflavin synthase
VTEDLHLGSSISLNGACLTVTRVEGNRFSVDVSEETRKMTTLPSLKIGERVNLERAISSEGRFGGHTVTGHVDGISRITGKKRSSGSTVFELALTPEFVPFMVERGSVAVDGVSLTVLAVKRGVFSVNIVPHTLQSTTFGFKKVADRVNIELDIIGKYVVNFLKSRQELKE